MEKEEEGFIHSIADGGADQTHTFLRLSRLGRGSVYVQRERVRSSFIARFDARRRIFSRDEKRSAFERKLGTMNYFLFLYPIS